MSSYIISNSELNPSRVFILQKSALEKRLDPFYHVPELLELEKKVLAKETKKARDYVVGISSGATPTMHISIIVAIAKNNAIGKDNKLLCHLSEDLKRFKKLTSGHTIIMGKTTYFSLPNRPLPNRRSIVITDVKNEQIDNCVMAYSIEDAIAKCDPDRENFVIGGASIYRQFMTHADKLYITWIHHEFEADTFFPNVDEKDWKVISKEDFNDTDEKNPYAYSYVIYKRK